MGKQDDAVGKTKIQSIKKLKLCRTANGSSRRAVFAGEGSGTAANVASLCSKRLIKRGGGARVKGTSLGRRAKLLVKSESSFA